MHKRTAMECFGKTKVDVRAEFADFAELVVFVVFVVFVGIGGIVGIWLIGCPLAIGTTRPDIGIVPLSSDCPGDKSELNTRTCRQYWGRPVRERYGKGTGKMENRFGKDREL